jgi:hypothetical protein
MALLLALVAGCAAGAAHGDRSADPPVSVDRPGAPTGGAGGGAM